jgi:hypothetical protein
MKLPQQVTLKLAVPGWGKERENAFRDLESIICFSVGRVIFKD